MTDNVTLSLGTADGAVIATDDIGGVHTPITKLSHGGLDSSTLVSTSSGLPVQQQGTWTVASHAVTNAGTFAVQAAATEADGANVTLGAKADAKSTATDTTAITAMSVWKQISSSVQAIATSVSGTLTVASHAVTNAGTFAVQATEADGANTTLGAKADAKSTATDTTSITIMSVLKQVSSSVQAIATSVAGTLTVATHAVTQSGTWTVQPGNTANTTAWKVDASSVAVPVTDNSGSLTVDGTVSVDAITTSVTPGTGAAHLGKAEDAAHGSGDTGVMALAVRRDADTTLADTTGDYAPFQVNAAGSLKVAITSGAGSGGTSIADEAAFTIGSTSLTPVGGQYNSTLDSLADGSAGIAHMTVKRAIHVSLRDATTGAEMSVGGGTQYDEDAVSAGGEKVTMAGVVRRDTAASSSTTDGDISTLATDATGRLWAHVGTIDGGTLTTVSTVTSLTQMNGAAIAMNTGARAAGVQRVTIATDDVVAHKADVVTAQTAAWTSATAQDTAITLTVTGYATVAMTINPTTTFSAGVLTFELSDDAGTTWYPVAATRMDSYASELTYTIVASTKRIWQVDVAGFTSYRVRLSTAITGSGTANLRIQATAASSEGSVTVGQSTAANLQATASQGGTWTVQPGNTANTTAWKVDGSAVTQPVSGTVTASNAAGDVAHDGVDSGNPVKMGAQARSSEPSAVSTNADRVNLIADMVGKLIVQPYANPENFVSGAITTAMTSTTTTSLVAAPASGLRNYITQITVSNAHATVGTDVIIQDGSGGTTLYTIPAAAVYGGATVTFPTPLRQPTTATAIFCANVTTGASTKVSASGWKGA